MAWIKRMLKWLEPKPCHCVPQMPYTVVREDWITGLEVRVCQHCKGRRDET